MNNQKIKIELIKLLKLCIKGETEGIQQVLVNVLEKEALDFHDMCILLFLIGEYTRISGDLFFYDTHKVQIEELQDVVKVTAYEAYHCLGGTKKGFYSANYGMAYGALYNSNLFGKREMIAEAIHEMKNYAYDTYTCAGKLIDEKEGTKATAQMLWLCVPFGLFTPEDLVLVAALSEMEDTKEQMDFAMLSWYFAEKADYRRARHYLGRLHDTDSLIDAIREVAEEKLRQAGMLSEAPFIHIPGGNFNRYEKQNYERSPWFPKGGEEVYVYAATWPTKYPETVEVHWRTSSGKQGSDIGYYQAAEENYRFSMGNFPDGENVTYYFSAGTYCSDEYCFDTLEKETMSHVNFVDYLSTDDIVIEMRSEQGNCYGLYKRTSKGQSLFSIKPLTIENDKREWKPFSEISKLQESILPISIIELYVWKEGERIFSVGMKAQAEREERFYGFGERYNHIDQRGNKVDVYVYNQYKDQGIRTYFPMPYFLSSKEYGIYLPTNRYTEFDLCCSDNNCWSVEVERDELSWYCFCGKPKEMISQFSSLGGKPVTMPDWAFGPWMSSNNWDSEAEVRKQVELTKKYDIPVTALVIEAWSDEATYYIFNDAVYEENNGEESFAYNDFTFPKWGKWPDPKGMVEYLHTNDIKCILWQIPIIKYINSLHHLQKDKDEAYALEQGFCAKKKDGTPYRMPEGWFTDSLLMDYTKKEAVDWWFEKRQYLVDDVKIDGFKTDGGEFVFGDEVQFADGRTGKEMRNEYPNLYIKEYYDYIHEKRDGIVFSRAGFTGAAQMPAHWAGDEKSTFSAFQRNLCAGLNVGISGVPYWGWDLAGFSGEIPSAELYARSVSMATFCPIMQYHAESKAEFNQDRTPWNIAERRNAPWVIDMYRFYAKLRISMLPYIIEEAKRSADTGIPMMRALWIEFPDDKEAGRIFDQYMFGDDLMVAPVVEEGKTQRMVYIPRGSWKHVFTGEEFSGNIWINMHAAVDEIIVLQKEGSQRILEFV